MPAKKTMRDVIPALWTGLNIDPRETERTLNRATFDRIMTTTETIVSPTVLDRMWKTLPATQYAKYSPYYNKVVILDVKSMKILIEDLGLTSLITLHTYHTHTYTDENQRILDGGESQ